MMSPEWLKRLPDITQRDPKSPVYDAALAATPANGDVAKPVGLGAFKFDSYTPGNGNSFKLSRNEDYWRGPKGITGEDLPYLDAIEGVVAVDIDSRSNSLRVGQFDASHTSNADTIKQFDGATTRFETIATSLFGDTGYIMLNVAEGDTDPQGTNAKSPLLNVHCRRALACARPMSSGYIEERDAGLTLPASGPFGPGMARLPQGQRLSDLRPGQGQREFDQCLADLGTQDIEFTFNTTNDPFNVETNTLIISMWNDALGGRVKAKITPVEQGQYIGLALTARSTPSPGATTVASTPTPSATGGRARRRRRSASLALNFGRFKDSDIDAALDVVHTSSGPGRPQDGPEKVNKLFGEQVYNIWLSWALWGIIEQPYVNGLESQRAARRRHRRRPGLLRPPSDEPDLVRRRASASDGRLTRSSRRTDPRAPVLQHRGPLASRAGSDSDSNAARWTGLGGIRIRARCRWWTVVRRTVAGWVSSPTRPSDGIGTITIDRPEKKNAMTYGMFNELWDAARQAQARSAAGPDPDRRARRVLRRHRPGRPAGHARGRHAEWRRPTAGPRPVAADGLPEADRWCAIDGPGDRDGRRVHVDVRRAHRHAPGPLRVGVRAPRPGPRHRRRHVDPAPADRGAGDRPAAVLGRDHVGRGHGRRWATAAVVEPDELEAAAHAEAARFATGSPFAVAETKALLYAGSGARSTSTPRSTARSWSAASTPRTTRRASPLPRAPPTAVHRPLTGHGCRLPASATTAADASSGAERLIGVLPRQRGRGLDRPRPRARRQPRPVVGGLERASGR